MSVQDLIADLVGGEIRHDSPSSPTPESRTQQGFSPDSPLSPRGGEHTSGEHAVPPLDASGYPLEPCPICHGWHYYRLADNEPWLCGWCHPAQQSPRSFLSVPGGRPPVREAQDVDTVLSAAVEGLAVTVAELRRALEAEDVAGIAAGRIPPESVRAFAQTLEGDISTEEPIRGSYYPATDTWEGEC